MLHYEIRKIIRIRQFIPVLICCLVLLTAGTGLEMKGIQVSDDQYQSDYHEYISGILEQTRHQQSMTAIFGNETVSEKSMDMGYAAYSRLLSVKLTGEPVLSAEPFFNCGIVRGIILLIALLLPFYLVFKDQMDRVDCLIRTTPAGKTRVIRSRIFAVCILCASLLLFFRGTVLIVGSCAYEPANLTAPVQMVPSFYGSALNKSVGEVMFMSLASDLLRIPLAVLTGFFFALLTENLVTALAALYIYLLANGAAVLFIGEWSYLKPIKAVSFFSYFYQEDYMRTWDVTEIGGLVTETWKLIMAVSVFGTGILYALVLYMWENRTAIMRRESLYLKKFRLLQNRNIETSGACNCRTGKVSLSGLEGKITFLYQRAWLVLLCVMLIEIRYYAGERYFTDETEYYYQKYSGEIEGSLTDEKIEKIQEMSSGTESPGIDYDSLQTQVEKGEISQSYMEYVLKMYELSDEESQAIERITKQVQRLYNMKKNGVPVEYVMETPYVVYLERNTGWYLDIIVYIFGVLIFGVNRSLYENKSGMGTIIKSRRDGEMKVRKIKRRYRILVITLLWLLSVLPRIIWIFRNFRVHGLLVHCRSIRGLEQFPFNIPLILFLALVLTLKLAVGLLLDSCAGLVVNLPAELKKEKRR